MLKPFKGKVILELIDKEKVTESGIVLTNADPYEANKGRVVAVSDDIQEIYEGDIVLPNWNKAQKTTYETKDYYIIHIDEIVAVFESHDTL
jgi:co-chaperonin GroES (HSP10)